MRSRIASHSVGLRDSVRPWPLPASIAVLMPTWVRRRSSMRILLHDNQICERGTTTSMLDYARVLRGNGHDVELAFWDASPANQPKVIERVRAEFPLHGHPEPDRIPASFSGFDSAYFIKAGFFDGLVLPETHNVIHAVFSDYEPHGCRYVYISQWLADHVRSQTHGRSGRKSKALDCGLRARQNGCVDALEFGHLNLIVDIAPPELGMREELGIPDEAFVITRFGGYDSFDVAWVQQKVAALLEDHPDWYFVGLNTKPFTRHSRAIFLPMTPDPVEKASVAAMGDVFLTARGEGEAFGVAIAEALQLGIPALAWEGGAYRNQVSMLKGLNGTFRTPRQLERRLKELSHGTEPSVVEALQQRGDEFRPTRVAPQLEALLQPCL